MGFRLQIRTQHVKLRRFEPFEAHALKAEKSSEALRKLVGQSPLEAQPSPKSRNLQKTNENPNNEKSLRPCLSCTSRREFSNGGTNASRDPTLIPFRPVRNMQGVGNVWCYVSTAPDLLNPCPFLLSTKAGIN